MSNGFQSRTPGRFETKTNMMSDKYMTTSQKPTAMATPLS